MTETTDTITLVAVGDVVPRLEKSDEQFDMVRPILKSGDVTFGQMEMPLSAKGAPPRNRTSLHMMGEDPHAAARVMVNAGFNVMSFAGNHTAERGAEAIIDTLDVARANNIAVMGAGRDIAEARTPAVLQRGGTKVGFLAYCSVLPEGHEATETSAGSAPVRATTEYKQWDWQAGSPPKIITKVLPEDLSAMVADIERLRPTVDVLVVSYHWGLHFAPATIAMYQHEAAIAAIDAGADLILGHHTHILKPIGVYKGKPIFYSMGNFALSISYNMMSRSDHTSFYNIKLDPEYPTYAQPIDSQKTVIVKCTIAGGRLQRAAFVPCWINKQGNPEPLEASDPRSTQVLEYMESICENQKLATRFERDGDDIVVDLSQDSVFAPEGEKEAAHSSY